MNRHRAASQPLLLLLLLLLCAAVAVCGRDERPCKVPISKATAVNPTEYVRPICTAAGRPYHSLLLRLLLPQLLLLVPLLLQIR